MKTINKSNVHDLCNQFTLSNLTCERAYIKDKGWYNINIDDSFSDSYEEIANLLGGRKETKARIKHILRNNPIHDWFASRIVYCNHTNRWTYTAGQDYPGEIKTIRQTLIKRYN